MSTQDPRRAPAAGALTALPQVQDLPVADRGYERARVEEAFDAFRRHATALQTQLKVLQAAPKGTATESPGHAVRMDALHLVRAAAEFADTLERDAQEAAVRQIARAEQEIREREVNLQQQEAEIHRIRQETERQRVELVNAARNEAREIVTTANRDSSQSLREAESSGSRLLEQSRHQATELTNAARAEVEQTLEWARAQADVIVQRARMGAEQLLAAAGHGEGAVHEAIEAIVRAAEETVQAARGPRRSGPAAEPQLSETPSGEERPPAAAETEPDETAEPELSDAPSDEERPPTVAGPEDETVEPARDDSEERSSGGEGSPAS